jgi:hypothetical protein
MCMFIWPHAAIDNRLSLLLVGVYKQNEQIMS